MPKQKCCNAVASLKGTSAKKKTYFSRSDDFSGNLLELEMENLKFCFVHHPPRIRQQFFEFFIIPRHPNTFWEGVLSIFLVVQIPSQEVFGCLGYMMHNWHLQHGRFPKPDANLATNLHTFAHRVTLVSQLPLVHGVKVFLEVEK